MIELKRRLARFVPMLIISKGIVGFLQDQKTGMSDLIAGW